MAVALPSSAWGGRHAPTTDTSSAVGGTGQAGSTARRHSIRAAMLEDCQYTPGFKQQSCIDSAPRGESQHSKKARRYHGEQIGRRVPPSCR